jgi:hypothetical protein
MCQGMVEMGVELKLEPGRVASMSLAMGSASQIFLGREVFPFFFLAMKALNISDFRS